MADGISPEVQQAYLYRASTADGNVLILGANGDDDPGFLLVDPVLSNDSAATNYRVSTSLAAAVAGTRCALVRAGYVVPLPGHYGQLVAYNVSGSGASVNVEVAATTSHLRNSGGGAGSAMLSQRQRPATNSFFHAFRLSVVANAATSTTWLVPNKAPNGATTASIKVWSKTPCTSAAGTYLLTVTATNPAGVVRSLITAFNLETISAATLTSATLSTTAADLVLRPGDLVTVTGTSNNADLVIGDVAVELAFDLL